MFYESFHDSYFDYFGDILYQDVLNFLGKFGYDFSGKGEVLDIFTSFDFSSLLDELGKELYTDKLFRENILVRFSEDKREQVASMYYDRASNAILSILQLLFGNLIYIEETYEIASKLQEVKSKTFSAYQYQVMQELVDKLIFVFRRKPYAFLYFMETKKIANMRDFLLWSLVAIERIMNVSDEALQYLNAITPMIEEWYGFLSELGAFNELTYSEYVRKHNKHELFFRNKLINVLFSRLFAELFSYWIGFFLNFKKYRVNDIILRPFEVVVKNLPHEAKSWPFVVIHVTFGKTLGFLKREILRPYFYKKFEVFAHRLEEAVLKELFVRVVDYFYIYAKHLLSFPKIKNTTTHLFELNLLPQYLIDDPERTLSYYLINFGFFPGNAGILEYPLHLLPPSIGKERIVFGKVLDKIVEFLSSKYLYWEWGKINREKIISKEDFYVI
ncbi:MAG: hypothetical protein RMJ17_00570 [Candidatus Aenigmarchaeota archaeon]|nr:hypothetical protein [Candidatus Aenigmarchaeota archaeon]MDW8149081.1 hypothetical protein [Candidatus Aenigmarchaeota archaeon]